MMCPNPYRRFADTPSYDEKRSSHASLAAVRCAVPEVLLSAPATAHAASYTFATIDVPDAIDTEATGINTRGQIAGFYAEDTETHTNQPAHGFLYENGVFTILRVSGALYTFALGINDGGQIVGYSQELDTAPNGFLYANGVFTTFDVRAREGKG